ncbi:MAG: hypothetical protein ACRDL6_10490 [Solirubrobacterales bacterium]
MAEAAAPARPDFPSLEEAVRWIGVRIDGRGERGLGRLAGLHVDAEGGGPRWAVIRLGPIKGCTAIPFAHVVEGAGRLWAAYERDRVRSAPRVKPDEALTALQELELCAHWAIREGKDRAAEVAGRDAGEISAVPAENVSAGALVD